MHTQGHTNSHACRGKDLKQQAQGAGILNRKNMRKDNIQLTSRKKHQQIAANSHGAFLHVSQRRTSAKEKMDSLR
jgi:hypothetical protein